MHFQCVGSWSYIRDYRKEWSTLTLISAGVGGDSAPPLRLFFNNFLSINAIDLKLYDFSYKSILHFLAKLRYPTYCQSENIGHNLKQPIQFFWKNWSKNNTSSV